MHRLARCQFENVTQNSANLGLVQLTLFSSSSGLFPSVSNFLRQLRISLASAFELPLRF